VDLPERSETTLSNSRAAAGCSRCGSSCAGRATDELARRLELHPNGGRVHLERLLD
jgi:hypothetical protein